MDSESKLITKTKGEDMEIIQITEEKVNALTERFNKMRKGGITFLIVGASMLILSISSSVLNILNVGITNIFTSTPSVMFFSLAIIFISQANFAMKKIKANEFTVYKAKCIQKRWIEYAVVENNEILSKKVKKPTKLVGIVGSPKFIQPGDDVGIIKFEKSFYAFALKE